MDIYAIFEKHDKEFLKFERVENKRSSRADLHAFLLLNELQPATKDIIAAAEHDIIYLDVDTKTLCVTEEQLIELHRCGVMWDSETDSLAMFV